MTHVSFIRAPAISSTYLYLPQVYIDQILSFTALSIYGASFTTLYSSVLLCVCFMQTIT